MDEPVIDVVMCTRGAVTQHYYVGGEVTFDSKPHVNSDRYLITGLNDENSILVTGGGRSDDLIVVNAPDVWVLSIPDEVKAQDGDTSKVAPFRIHDDYGYADDVLFWDYRRAVDAALEFVDENDCDCIVENAYGNQVEYFEYQYEEDEEEEESDDEE